MVQGGNMLSEIPDISEVSEVQHSCLVVILLATGLCCLVVDAKANSFPVHENTQL